MEMIAAEGRGVILYLRRDAQGAELVGNRGGPRGPSRRPSTESSSARAIEFRSYGIGAQILKDLGLREIRLMTNNPGKVVGLEGIGIRVVERVPLEISPNATNRKYLQAKRDRMGHLLTGEENRDEKVESRE